MADFNALETLINAYIKKNGVQAITGNILNGVLRGMVSALGKGYTIVGVATPSTDPGTMTGPCAYYASTYGTYTNFGNIVVNDGEIAMLIYDEQTWHKEKMWRLDAEASIDANVGTPSVETSFEDELLTFRFHNIKGEQGDAAGFGTVTASVDSNIGTPGVSVQTSGPDTAKNMTFQFTNLKGETGVTSVVCTVDNTIGTPSCAVSLVGQELHLDFSGLKGAQGDTGVSADYPITIVNNLTTSDPTSALSAQMGVQLESEISQLELKIDGIVWVDKSSEVGTLSHAKIVGAHNNLEGQEIYSASEFLATPYIAVTGGGKIRISIAGLASTGNAGLAFYDSSKTLIANQGIVYENEGTANNDLRELTIPSGASYIRTTIISAVGTTVKFYELTQGQSYEERISDLEEDKADKTEVEDLETEVNSLKNGNFIVPNGERELSMTKNASLYASSSATSYLSNSNGWFILWYKTTRPIKIRYQFGSTVSSGAAQICISDAEPDVGVSCQVILKEQPANSSGYIEVEANKYIGCPGNGTYYYPTLYEQIYEQTNLLDIATSQNNHRINDLAPTYYNGVRLVDTLTKQRFGHSTVTKIGNFTPVSATEDTITLSAEDAACIAYSVILACKMDDGDYRFVYFGAASGNVITKLYDFGANIDCQDIVEMQSLHDTTHGIGGIHLSPFAYRAMAHDIYSQLQTLAPFGDVFVGGWVAQFCKDAESYLDTLIKDKDGNLLCSPVLDGIVASQGCLMVYKANTPSDGPFYRTYYNITQTSPNGASVTFPINALYPFRGFLRVQLSRVPPYTGTATMKVYDIKSGELLYTKVIPSYADTYYFSLSDKFYSGVNVKIEMPDASATRVRISSMTLHETYAKLAQIRPIDEDSTVALLGSSNTQYPPLAVAQELCPGDSDNVVITRPDGTTGDGCGYLGKELARISGASVDNWGKSGEQTAWGIEEIQKIFAHKRYSHIILSLFANDINNGKSVSGTIERVRQMVEYAKGQGCVPIVLMGYGLNTTSSANGYYAFGDSLLEGMDSVFCYTASSQHT